MASILLLPLPVSKAGISNQSQHSDQLYHHILIPPTKYSRKPHQQIRTTKPSEMFIPWHHELKAVMPLRRS